MTWNEHVKNRNQFPADELAKYAGQEVAWSIDGNRILAADADPLKLIAKLDAAGYARDEFILSYVE